MAYEDYQKAWYSLCVFENGVEEDAALESPYCGIKVVS